MHLRLFFSFRSHLSLTNDIESSREFTGSELGGGGESVLSLILRHGLANGELAEGLVSRDVVLDVVRERNSLEAPCGLRGGIALEVGLQAAKKAKNERLLNVVENVNTLLVVTDQMCGVSCRGDSGCGGKDDSESSWIGKYGGDGDGEFDDDNGGH